jgi:hypothetical protein
VDAAESGEGLRAFAQRQSNKQRKELKEGTNLLPEELRITYSPFI